MCRPEGLQRRGVPSGLSPGCLDQAVTQWSAPCTSLLYLPFIPLTCLSWHPALPLVRRCAAASRTRYTTPSSPPCWRSWMAWTLAARCAPTSALCRRRGCAVRVDSSQCVALQQPAAWASQAPLLSRAASCSALMRGPFPPPLQVVVIGATNRVDALDGALRRPGRWGPRGANARSSWLAAL